MLLVHAPHGVLSGTLAELRALLLLLLSCRSSSEGSGSGSNIQLTVLPATEAPGPSEEGRPRLLPIWGHCLSLPEGHPLLPHIVPLLSPAGPSPGLPLPFSLAS